jgi:hypothetical protein
MGDPRKSMTMSMRDSMRPIIVFSALFAASAGLRAEGTFVKLRGAQIQAIFTGVEMTDGVHWADVFAAGGILATYAMGRKTTGTWRVEKDQLCVDRGKDDSDCYQVWLAGKKVELRHEGSSLPLEGILQKPVSRN